MNGLNLVFVSISVLVAAFVFQPELFCNNLCASTKGTCRSAAESAQVRKLHPILYDSHHTVKPEVEAEKEQFLKEWGDYYGYDGKIDSIVANDLKRVDGDVYLDYTGSGVYLESQIREVMEKFSGKLYGNAHSNSPSSLRTEGQITSMRARILKHFNASSDEYTVIFTSGATAALKLVGETFPWTDSSQFLYLRQNHNSVLGIREIALEHGAEFYVVGEDDIDGDGHIKVPSPMPHPENTTYSLFAFPAQDNYAGVKYPLEWIEGFQHPGGELGHDALHWKVLLDAAAFVPTTFLDLNKYKPDFVTISFYKMFGFPTGIGALLVKNDNIPLMHKTYFGGGTVKMSASDQHWIAYAKEESAKFEDGTLGFLNIAALESGFDALNRLGMDNINRHVHSLTQYLFAKMMDLQHLNGAPMVEIYGKHVSKNSRAEQGGVINFSLKKPDGSYAGYYDFQQEAGKSGFHVRSGCHCNPGACYGYLNIDWDEVKDVAKQKEGCGDRVDKIHGKPFGSVRVSLGVYSTIEDVLAFLEFLQEHFSYAM